MKLFSRWHFQFNFHLDFPDEETVCVCVHVTKNQK